MPRRLHIFGLCAGRLAERHEVRFVAHQKVYEARQKTGIVDGLSQHVGLQAGESQKSCKHIRFAGEPPKYGNRRFMTVFGRASAVFCFVQHLFTEVTYFSTKSP